MISRKNYLKASVRHQLWRNFCSSSPFAGIFLMTNHQVRIYCYLFGGWNHESHFDRKREMISSSTMCYPKYTKQWEFDKTWNYGDNLLPTKSKLYPYRAGIRVLDKSENKNLYILKVLILFLHEHSSSSPAWLIYCTLKLNHVILIKRSEEKTITDNVR